MQEVKAVAGTILEYLKEFGDNSLKKAPFSEVDSLVLCQFAYLKFDGLVPEVGQEAGSVSLKELAAHPDYENLYADERYEKDNRALFEGMLASRRFRNMRMKYYINIVEKKYETQFSAVTFFLDDGTTYVAFRGTDESIVGWKEDFNMAFLSPVPGQEYSVKYLNMVSEKFTGPFYVGGHSKGGNLAVYSAMNCKEWVADRILKVYCMDGPGFRPEVLEQCRYKDIEEKVVKILPHSSLVGMLFEWGIHFEVVESKNIGLSQHNPYSWIVEEGHFRVVKGVYESRKRSDENINKWLLSLNEEQLRTFVDTLFQVIAASETDNLIDFTADWKKSMNGMIAAMQEIDEKTAKMLKEIVKSLFIIASERMKADITAGIRQAEETVKHVSRRTKAAK